jgi:hypothetical protein
MARCYSLATMVRKVPSDLMEEFFEKEAKSDLGIDWSEIKKSKPEVVEVAFQELPQEKQDYLEQLLCTLHEVSCTRGLDALLEAATLLGDSSVLREWIDGNHYAKVMWCYLNRPKVYQKAILLYRVTTAKWWRQRNDLPDLKHLDTATHLKNLERALSRFLEKMEGRGKKCTAEYMQRAGKEYILVHADDYPEEIFAHVKGSLVSQTIRGTFLMVYELDKERRTLQVEAAVARPNREQLEILFMGELFDHRLDSFAKPVHELDLLKHDSMRWITDPKDATEVKLLSLRLQSKSNPRESLVLDTDPVLPEERIYAQIRETLAVSVDKYTVIKAKVRFRFESADNEKATQTTFELTASGSTFHPHKVKDAQADIIERCLLRSGVKINARHPRTPGTLGQSRRKPQVG